MKKKVTILTGDYWHPTNSITPVLGSIFDESKWEMTVSEDPNILSESSVPDLFVTFKDVIENDQIPTPLWCDDRWTAVLDSCIKDHGMGFMAVHCGIADIPKEHKITQDILRAFFVTHPPQCTVSFEPAENEFMQGIKPFTFSHLDEHYVMEMTGETEMLGYSVSQNGKQPAVWRHSYGKGRVAGLTPGHSYENLSEPEYLKLLIRCAEWCVR